MLVQALLCHSPHGVHGRVAFASEYKEALANRSHGSLPAAVAEHLSAALVGTAAVRTFLAWASESLRSGLEIIKEQPNYYYYYFIKWSDE